MHSIAHVNLQELAIKSATKSLKLGIASQQVYPLFQVRFFYTADLTQLQNVRNSFMLARTCVDAMTLDATRDQVEKVCIWLLIPRHSIESLHY